MRVRVHGGINQIKARVHGANERAIWNPSYRKAMRSKIERERTRGDTWYDATKADGTRKSHDG